MTVVAPVALAESDLAAAQVGAVVQDKVQAVQARAKDKDMDAAHLPRLLSHPKQRLKRPQPSNEKLSTTPRRRN